MEGFNPKQEVKVDYEKEEFKDPALTEIISGLDDSNENVQKIKKLENNDLKSLSEVASGTYADIPLDVFLEDLIENTELADEVVGLLREWSAITKKESETTNIPEINSLREERNNITKRMSGIFDNL
jgi:hypothetical protein